MVYMQYKRRERINKSTNHHLSIAPMLSQEVGTSARTLSFYHSMVARASAASNNATMCDVLTHCSRPTHHLRPAHHQCLLLQYIPNPCFFTSRTRVPSRSSPLPTATQNRLSTNAISTNLPFFVLHVGVRFMVQRAGLQRVSLYGSHQHTPRAYQIVIVPR
jgi:hypothetical protein